MLFATDGIITRVSDTAGGDRIINLITPDRGRICVIVKGRRSPDNQAAAISQLFTHGNFEIYEKGGTYWLRGGTVLESFYGLSNDIVNIAAATYLCELANELTDTGEECGELIRLLLNSLYLICKGKKQTSLVKAVFELRAMAMSGYMPDVGGCSLCGSDLKQSMFFDVMAGHLICEECFHGMSQTGSGEGLREGAVTHDYDDIREASVICPLTGSAAAALRYIILSPSNRVFSFELSDREELDCLERLSEVYVTSHLGRGFESLDFYKTVK